MLRALQNQFFLFHVLYVFNLVYPGELKLVYGLIEMIILGMPLSIGKSSILSDFCRQINIM